LSRRGIQVCRTVLRAALEDAVEEGLMRRSPANKVPMPKYIVKQGLQREQAYWSEAEVAQFVAVSDEHRWGAGFRLCVLYGLRRSELLALRWDDINTDEQTVRVDEGLIEVKGKMVWTEAKSARSRRTIPIDASTMRRVRQHQAAQLRARMAAESWEDSTLVFTTRTGAPVQPRHFDRVLERLVVRAGVPRLTSHGLRHTAATHMMQGTKDYSEFRAIADIAGHSPEMLLKVYAHTLPSAMQAVTSRVGRRSAALDGD
jgi:integrase